MPPWCNDSDGVAGTRLQTQSHVGTRLGMMQIFRTVLIQEGVPGL